ncbi:hypothetical protein [Paeniglutamicibacter terrestris]|uniref:Uncharacterized protein n=1 Tax=Paeniglutamicibacter terrestris TaxID=2723403 RepID=A0ABX1G849_9MICC|nr:hypothetical protein [Paeniglutamicibacter terrestris]NKG22431.1 hypothetical protein [Paeniglutamicibacter terrestris]
MDVHNNTPGTFTALGGNEQGRWLHARLATSFGDPNTVVPRGFEAYARILHPILRDRPKAPETWETVFTSETLSMEEELVSWATVAAVQGQQVERYSQGSDLVAPVGIDPSTPWVDAQGWRYGETVEGFLDATTLSRVAVILSRYTSTPANGVAALWEGWGSGTSARYASSKARNLVNTIRWLTGGVRAKAHPARSRATAARLQLPGRNHRLYSAGITEFTDPEWQSGAPWADAEGDAHSPNILWPADHAWVLVTEVDYDSTVVAGSRALMGALLASPGIEALEVGEDIEEHLRMVPGDTGN